MPDNTRKCADHSTGNGNDSAYAIHGRWVCGMLRSSIRPTVNTVKYRSIGTVEGPVPPAVSESALPVPPRWGRATSRT